MHRRDFLKAAAAALWLPALPGAGRAPAPKPTLLLGWYSGEWSFAVHEAERPGEEVLRLWLGKDHRTRVLGSEFRLADKGLTLYEADLAIEDVVCGRHTRLRRSLASAVVDNLTAGGRSAWRSGML